MRRTAELLQTERLNMRHSPLLRSPESLNGLIRKVLDKHFPEATLTLDLDDGIPQMSLDATRMRLLIRNLVDNALRHGGEGPIRIGTRLESDRAVLRIADRGPGVPPEHLPQVLEPFYRADPARQRKTGSFGLGLYLCRLIAEAHGGGIDVASRDAEGTQVGVSLPLRRAAPAE